MPAVQAAHAAALEAGRQQRDQLTQSLKTMARAMKVRTALHSQKDEMCLCIFGGLQSKVTVPCVQAGKDQGRASRRSSYAGSESAPALSPDAERGGGGGIGRRYRAALSGESTPTSSVRAPAWGGIRERPQRFPQ